MATVAISPEPRVVLSNVSWETYERLLADLADSSAPRLTFDRGVLEIMSPTPEHEEMNRTINLIVEIVAAETRVPVRNLGSTTFKREDLDRGFEPDSCFYVASAERIRGKKRIDLSTDPPPDLIIEIDTTSSSIPKLRIYADFRVPEVWQHDGTTIRILKLHGSDYVESESSLAFPVLTVGTLRGFLEKSQEWEDRPRFVKAVQDWARTVATS